MKNVQHEKSATRGKCIIENVKYKKERKKWNIKTVQHEESIETV